MYRTPIAEMDNAYLWQIQLTIKDSRNGTTHIYDKYCTMDSQCDSRVGQHVFIASGYSVIANMDEYITRSTYNSYLIFG